MADMHVAAGGFIRKYIFSLDHKVIGIQYWLLGLLAVLIGMTLSVLVRFHLVWPDARIPLLHLLSPTGAKGDVIQPEYYLSLLTLHGPLMLFFVLATVPQSAFGDFALPIP